MTLGEKIRKLRQEAELSQAQLADALTVSRAAVAKWENENGIPDIGNLKAICDYFHCDLDSLLDEEKELTFVKEETVTVNLQTFCGKSCDDCTYKETLECPGCKAGPADRYHGSCEIAKCCRNHAQRSCLHCSLHARCSTLKSADSKPRQRESAIRKERLLRDTLQRQAPVFGKWLWILFWLIVPANIADFLTLDLFAEVPTALLIGRIGTAACTLIYGLILLRLSKENDRFKTAGICCVIKCGISLLNSFVNVTALGLLLAILSVVVSLVEMYYEYIGYCEVLLNFHNDLSAKWEMLWKANLWLYCILIGCMLLLVVLRVLGALILLICVIGLVVVSIIKFVYLYQTAKFFREAS